MTDDDRKFLTEAMREDWVEPYLDDYADYGKGRTNLRIVDRNRTFTTWDDFGAVQKELWSPEFQAWLETRMTWREWEKKTPEEKCSYYIIYLKDRKP